MRYKRTRIACLFLLLVLILSACGSGAKPVPTLPPIPPTVPPTLPPPTSQPVSTPVPLPQPTAPLDVWGQIQARGTMIVGTSTEYPPFETYNSAFQLDGFDIALMQEIGKRLGVKVEFRDYNFEGLTSALQTRQLDAAIAAMAVTSERLALMDFTQPYYAGTDALLARSDFPTIYKSLESLTNVRLGVENGSVYQSIVQQKLVDTNILPADHVYVYANIQDAVQQLLESRLELVLMDKNAADSYTASGNVIIVGTGLTIQQFSIATQKGAATLVGVLNQALQQMQADGTINQLGSKYLGVTEISSGAMPDLQPAAAPAQACVNDMVLDAILTYDDKNMTSPPPVPPGQPFIKGWRVRNTGTCTWDANYQLVYDIGSPQGAQMNGQPLTLAGQTPPGSTLDLQLSLSAPVQGGIYHGMWSLREPSGHLFGQRLIVGVNVSMQPTNTPFPTATASPTILFTANPGHIRAGDPVTLQWAVSGPGQVYVYAVGEPWQNYPVPPTGSRLAYPAVTTIYELRYIHPDNQVETRQVTVLVDPTPNAPQIFLFSITPPYQIYQGQSLEIDWDVRGQVTSVRILRNNGVLYDRAPFRGSINDTPQAAGVYTYVLEATGPGGVNRQSRTVYVYPPVVFTPTPTSPAPITPTPIIDPVFIRSFSVMPSQVQIGACVQISWDIVGALANLRLERAGKVIVDGNSAVNTATDCPDTIGTVVYTLTATNPVGQSDARQDSVQVDPVMPTVGPVGPVIQSFTGSADTVDVGQCVVLSWSVTGDAITNIALTVNGAPLTNTMDKNGSYNSCPTAAGRFTYQLDVTASGGSASDTFVVDVQEPLPTFAPPPTDEPPVPATDEPPLPPTIEPPLQPTDLPAPDIQDTPTPESSSSVAAWLGWAVDQVYSMGSQVVSSWH